VDQLKENGLCVIDFKINLDEFRQYLERAQYNRFPEYYGGGKGRNFVEKSLEHYLAAKVLQISRNDVYIDIASANSPAAEIYHRLYGCETYRQDIVFPSGINGNTIGGDACNMPVADGFATKMALHCSFEHFEQDSDIRFIKEAGRVLRKGGKLCIVPLYLFESYIAVTDPANLSREERAREGALFDSDVALYCAKGWGLRHARFYDVTHLIARIIKNSDLKSTIYVIQNEKAVDNTCYARFIAVFEKNGS
jgi:SAM-dependent methyltransferase